MSDVEAVSLPAALDVSPNAIATVKADSGPSSPGKPVQPPRLSDEHPVESEEEVLRADSEAETIIQSGRESLSPEKKRKHIRHDPQRRPMDGVDGNQRKKPRINGDRVEPDNRHSRSSRSPHPSERPASPSSVVKVEKVDDVPSVTPGVLEEKTLNDADRPRLYRKRSFSDSVEEKRERRRDSAAHLNLKQVNNHRLPRPSSSARSVSPTRHSHQRSVSGSHLPNKKKAPTPHLSGFQRQASEDRLSTSSSASGSPLPSAHLRRLGSGMGASASPAKQIGPKKLKDKSGRTPLARACADGKYEQVVQRYEERPEDLNVPDNAGNTPLQIASLNGEAPIVEFLLKAGCDIDTHNIDKDTPLIDAVENGHIEVIKLLLDAGANPRTLNASGDEPYELVPTDLRDDEYDEIRKAIADAKASSRPSRRSEEHTRLDSKNSLSRRASVASPSRSPPPMSGAASRRKTGRSEATRNEFLWTQATPEKLREYAAKGDEQGVVSVLNILQKADNVSLIAAAKGGHEDVLSLMYAMGDADADPNPVKGHGQKSGYNTPMLAAIGRGKPAIIQLILNQPGFDPTRRLYEGATYYELSKARQGENWEEEHEILKSAFEKCGGSRKSNKDLSSPRRARKEKDDKRSARRESSSPARPKKLSDSPNRQRAPKDIDALKQKRREKEKAKAISRPKVPREINDCALASSDQDSARAESVKPKMPTARRGSESSGMARPDEIRKRRLIAGRRPQDQERDHEGERRSSFFSSDSGREEGPKSRNDSAPEPISSLKRIRNDNSPERSRSRDTDSDRLSPESRKKKRRVLADEKLSGAVNGAPRKTDEAIDGEKSHRRPQEPPSRPAESMPHNSTETLKKSIPFQHSFADHDSAKKNGDFKTEPREANTNFVPEAPTNEKRAEIESEQRRQAEAKKTEQDRLAAEKRAAEEAERDRLAKEEEERVARLAREKAEEDERKRKEAEQRKAKQAEDEKIKRIELERARVMKMRRDQEAQEKRRREALPGRLRVSAKYVGNNDSRARSHTWLKNFMPLVTAVTRQLEPTCAADIADEKWIPNYLVAPLLATNDLQLSQYASWEKRKATPTQRSNLWRCTRRMLVHTDDPRYRNASFGEIMQLVDQTRPKYEEMEHVFWIRLSDFMDLEPHIPHLNGFELEFMSMHIDPEPSAGPGPHTNGHAHSTLAETNGSPVPNGHGYPRTGTYF
ncbi:uncharacterized protein N7477_003855 [Penicillium maclennaniae]|uniref:uncharacterized protein n=1 Tax=Penicillium maclennaniae TaxID=1343394 RepID=UPI002540AA7C|nr:uncharacterized protein N7477_003855 [Penicillium maclennaniae]KAJ5678222.1 hypothetical protein N7477_003855 [Penicillium maclennaniae]